MDDEELRARLNGLLRAVDPVHLPPIAAIRRRLRIRRATQATAGALACACIVIAAVLARGAAGPAGPVGPSHGGPPGVAPPCASHDLAIRWIGRVPTKAVSIEPLPETFLLGLRNTGHAACSLKGWPRLVMTRQPPNSSLSNGTLSTLVPPQAKGTTSRVVDPTRVLLSRGASAVSAVTVSYAPHLTGCVQTSWSVSSPIAESPLQALRGGPRLICAYSAVTVSPVYPAGVPLSRNYPRSVNAASPASPAYPLPAKAAGPGAAPYFVTIDQARAPAPVVVHAWRTGKVIATIQPPARSGGFIGVAGTGSDTSFVLAAGTIRTRFYQLILLNGKAQPLVPLPVPSIAALGSFAISTNGTDLALALAATGGTARIEVVSLVNGSTRTWKSRTRGAVTGLTWAGNVNLAFTWNATATSGSAAAQSGLRILDTGRSGGDLLSSKLLIPASVRFGSLSGIAYPLASADGTAVFATMTSHAGGNAKAAVVQFSGTTGRPLRLIAPPVGESGFGTWCGALWSDPSGSAALAACRVQGEELDGSFKAVNLHFPAPNLSAGPDFFAW